MLAITRWRGLRWWRVGLRGGAASASDDCLDRVCVWGRLEQTGVPGWVITGNGWNVSQRWRTEPSLGFRSQRFHVCLSWKIFTLAHLPETAVKNARSLSELRGSGGLSLWGAAGKYAKLTIHSQEARAGNWLLHRKLEEIHFKNPSWRGFYGEIRCTPTWRLESRLNVEQGGPNPCNGLQIICLR